MGFAPDLGDNIAHGDAYYLSLLDECDAYVVRNGLDLPRGAGRASAGPIRSAWSTRCSSSTSPGPESPRSSGRPATPPTYAWLQVDAFDSRGKPQHQRGVSSEPGVYFLGLPWLSRRGSSFIWGVWHDARYLADHIQMLRGYLAYGSASIAVNR